MDIKKIINSIGFLGILLLLCACPSTENQDCDDAGSQALVDNLITITPLKSIYQQGEEITVKCTIPSENNYFGGVTTNIFDETQDNEGIITFSMYSQNDLFTNNSIDYIKGASQNGNIGFFVIPYFESSKNYEFEIKISLNRVGNYKIPAITNTKKIDFQGSPYCNRFQIATGIQGYSNNGDIEFTVQ